MKVESFLSYWIVLFVNFLSSITEIQLNKFKCTFSSSICANDLGKSHPNQHMGGGGGGGQAVIISLAQIKRGNVHVICSIVSP